MAPIEVSVRGLELDDLRLVDLVDDGAVRPRQPVRAGIQARRQNHRLPDARRAGIDEEVVEEPRPHRDDVRHEPRARGVIVVRQLDRRRRPAG